MELIPIRTRALKAPKDDLLAAIAESKLKLKEGDILAISSKVVSIYEGRAVSVEGTDKEKLVEAEADWYVRVRKGNHRHRFTIAKGHMAGSSGIDQSNGNGHYILYPEDPFKSANRLRKELSKKYGIEKLAVLITDSASVPFRRGAIGFALAWDNFVPLKDYRKKSDLFGRPFKVEVANIADGLAAGAVVTMGEGDESTPLVIIRGANVEFGNKKTKEPLVTALEDDMFAPFFLSKKWKRGGRGQSHT
jgi:coenzyme F420-0:L-glutamate ligase